MRRSILVVCALLAGTTLGCDRWNLLVDKIKNRNKPPATAARDTTKRTPPANPAATGTAKTPGAPAAKPGPATGTTKAPPPAAGAKGPVNTITPAGPTAAAPQPPPPQSRPMPQPAPPRPVLADEPYNSADTGTIAPGMSSKDVVALWGAPAAERHAGTYTYLLYPNGCEHTCGTADLVILQNDQVVDAVLRWHGHGYSGQSSSPRALPPGGRKSGSTE